MKTLVVCGATASGKTGFAVDMAEKIGGEVVSAECMLVYRGLNIGTAKPTPEEMRSIPHHMRNIPSAITKRGRSGFFPRLLRGMFPP